MITLAQIQAAYPHIKANAHRTPIFQCRSIAERCGITEANLHLKMENLQRTGSFKIRGALHRISQLSDAEKAKGVVGASAGNHAQGLALAATLGGVQSTVFMPEFASIAKIQATRRYGAHVILEGKNFDEAVAAGKARAEETGATFISAYDDDGIITGQGSVGLEIIEEIPDVDTVLICVGGGGLFAGTATAIKGLRPQTRIIGVQAKGAPAAVEDGSCLAAKSIPSRTVWRSNRPVSAPSAIFRNTPTIW
jgi:threonine dehydratase